MALEKIEEEFGLLAVLRDAVNFYLSYLQDCTEDRTSAIAELADVAIQVEQMNQKKEQADIELESLRKEQDRIDSEFKSIAPYVELLSKIDTIKQEMDDSQRKLREKEEALGVQERVAKSTPGDGIIQDKLKRGQALFRGEKVSADLILKRLGDDLKWYSQRLGDTGVNTKEIGKQSQAVRVRLQKIIKTVADKARNLKNMEKFVQSRQGQLNRLEELKEDLSKHEADLANITEVARLVSEVPFDVQPVPAEHTG